MVVHIVMGTLKYLRKDSTGTVLATFDSDQKAIDHIRAYRDTSEYKEYAKIYVLSREVL